jgi:hypothetical protein
MTRFEKCWGIYMGRGGSGPTPTVPLLAIGSGYFWAKPLPVSVPQHISDPVILHTYLPMKMEQSVPKRRHIKFGCRGITQKKAYNIQKTAKVWNQEYKDIFSEILSAAYIYTYIFETTCFIQQKKVKYIFTDMFSMTYIISNFIFALSITTKIKTGGFWALWCQKYFTSTSKSEYSRELLHAT